MIRSFCFVLTISFLILACKQESKTPQKPQTPSPPATPTRTVSEKQYPSISLEELQMVWDSCDFVDYTFYKLPMSMSFDNKASIQRVLQHISSTAPVIMDDCKATGRAYFQKQGEDLAVVEFYLHKDCNFFVFLKDGKPAYANQLTQAGFEFYQNSIQQAMGQFQQQSNGQGH